MSENVHGSCKPIGYPGTEFKRLHGATVPHASAYTAVPQYKPEVEVGRSLSVPQSSPLQSSPFQAVQGAHTP